MTLLDILGTFDTNKSLKVIDLQGKELARYDGKNSIPVILSDKEVFSISVDLENNIPFLIIAIR